MSVFQQMVRQVYNADTYSLTGKIEFALHYIDTEIEDKLAQAEADIRAQEAELDAKIAGVQALVDKLAPPPVGTIQFSASQSVGDDWLRCDGRFVSETDYPELVAALGKLTPSGDKFKLLSSGEITPPVLQRRALRRAAVGVLLLRQKAVRRGCGGRTAGQGNLPLQQ